MGGGGTAWGKKIEGGKTSRQGYVQNSKNETEYTRNDTERECEECVDCPPGQHGRGMVRGSSTGPRAGPGATQEGTLFGIVYFERFYPSRGSCGVRGRLRVTVEYHLSSPLDAYTNVRTTCCKHAAVLT